MQRFTGRTAFVTGAADGIGKAISRRLLAEGGNVTVTDLDAAAAERTARELAADATHGTAIGLACDVREQASVDQAMRTAVSRFGGLDVLVNNVGIDFGTPFEDITEESWMAQTDPTLYGAVRCIQSALPHLQRSEHAAVVAISSVNGMAAISGAAYSAAKAGVINLIANLASYYSPSRVADRSGSVPDGGRPDGAPPHGVRFNAVSPGTIRTGAWDRKPDGAAALERMRRQYPMGRVGRPEDIAAAVAFLASDDAAWITGINLPVEGGLLAGPQFPD